VFISHTGEIYPSGFLPISAGNVCRDSLVDVYRNSPLFRTLRNADNLHGKCGECEFRKLCGGSRSRSFALTGDYLAEDPRCVYRPKWTGGRKRSSRDAVLAAKTSVGSEPLVQVRL
jgi:radical SAM protein with 4Fe4S-binding SPASM domain